MTFFEWDCYEWRGPKRSRAVELFAQQIAFAELEKQETITLPVFAAKVLLSCARDGQHKGQGRRRPPDSQTVRIMKRSVGQWTRQREEELVMTGMKRSRAKNQAAEDAQAEFGKRIGLSAQYIKRKAHTKS